MRSVNKRNSKQQGHAAANTGTNNLYNIRRGEEGQLQHFLVRATFSSFTRPNHLETTIIKKFLFFTEQDGKACGLVHKLLFILLKP